MQIDPKKYKSQNAKELFAVVIADLVYSRVALALDPQIAKTIENRTQAQTCTATAMFNGNGHPHPLLVLIYQMLHLPKVQQ